MLAIHPPVETVEKDGIKVSYFRSPGVALLAQTKTNLEPMRYFLKSYDEKYEFEKYLDDPVKLTDADQLIKTAGQGCYLSFGPKRSTNENAAKYFEHIKDSGHESIFEHANFTLLIYGVSRALSHELVRHRIGLSPSQLSQRFVDNRALRFVEQEAFQQDDELHQMFLDRIIKTYKDYHTLTDKLLEKQKAGLDALQDEHRTAIRKKLNQTARALLPNETETTLILTGNARAFRHLFSLRATAAADLEIRRLAITIYQILVSHSAYLFNDYELKTLPDNTAILTSKYKEKS